MTRIQHIGLMVLMAGIAGIGLAGGCGDSAGREADGTDTAATAADPAAGNDAHANESGLPLFLDLGSKKCIPCKMMAPIIDELQRDYSDKFETRYVDVGRRENIPIARKHGIRVIPTQIFFDADGKELWRHEGFMSKQDILGKWAELGYEFSATDAEADKPAGDSKGQQ